MSDSRHHASLLAGRHREAGALVTATGVPRHYGSPAEEYAAAFDSAIVIDRSHRFRLQVTGPAPGQMINGVMAGALPKPPKGAGPLRTGSWTYSAVLQPKGRMVTDLRAFSVGHGGEENILLDVPAAGGPDLLAHLARFLPPRLAKVTDRSSQTGMLTLIGPDAAGAIQSAFEVVKERLGSGKSERSMFDLDDPRSFVTIEVGAESLMVTRSGLGGPLDAFDVIGDPNPIGLLWDHVTDGKARPAGGGVLETLRVEAGTPAFGYDMDQSTLPPEAGIEDIAIDHAKGCYTGQEVIVRIRDRGHVNRHLRGLRFEDDVTPPAGSELFGPGQKTAVGKVTSAVSSPRYGVIGLGYVRREFEPPAQLHLGEPGGASVWVGELSGDWWPEHVQR